MNVSKVGQFSANWGKKAVTQLGKSGALLPVVLLEVTVDTGRAYHAKKRGGKTEMRERMIDDISAGIFWLFGASMFNKLGDKIGQKWLGIKNPVFSAGKDKARDCLQQGILANPNIDPKKLAAFKFSKLILSILAAVGLIGWILPKINQSITRKILKKDSQNKMSNENKNLQQIPAGADVKKIFDDFEKYKGTKKENNPSFGKVSPELLGKLAHNFEHNAAYRLAAIDCGILVGRTTNARTFDEGLEYAFRDSVSSYFYLFATGNIIALCNKFDKFKGKNTGIDPTSAVTVNNYLADIINGQKIGADKFKQMMFGKLDETKYGLLKGTLDKNKGFITVEDFIRLTGADDALAQKARDMAKLQPALGGVSRLTDEQAKLVLSDGKLTDPKFLYETINGYFGSTTKKLFGKNKGKITSQTTIQDGLSYFAISDIEKFRKKIWDYVESVADMATVGAAKQGGPAEITMDVLKKASKRNSVMHSSYLIAGIGISALFLSTLIPKMQYWITRKRTGKTGFPGIEECKNKKDNSKTQKSA